MIKRTKDPDDICFLKNFDTCNGIKFIVVKLPTIRTGLWKQTNIQLILKQINNRTKLAWGKLRKFISTI